MMNSLQILIIEIDAFLERHSMSPTAFSRLAAQDPNFIRDLKKKGRVPNIGLVDRVRMFMQIEDAKAPKAVRHEEPAA